MDQPVRLDDGLEQVRIRRDVLARHQDLAARLHAHVGIFAGGVDVTAGQDVDIGRLHVNLVTHVDVAVDGDVAAAGRDGQQAHLGFAQVALADDTVDVDAIRRGQNDLAAGGGIQGAAGDVFVVGVQHQGADMDADAGGIAATDDGKLVVGGDETVDQDLGTGLDRDVRPDVDSRDGATNLDVAGGLQDDGAIHAGQVLGPGALAGGVDLEEAAAGHGEAQTQGIAAGLDVDAAAAPDATAEIDVAQGHFPRRLDFHARALAGPGIAVAVEVIVLAGLDAAGQIQDTRLDADDAVIFRAVQLGAVANVDLAASLDVQQ